MSDTRKRTVRVGLLGDAMEPEYVAIRPFYLSSVTGQIGDRALFNKHVGDLWPQL